MRKFLNVCSLCLCLCLLSACAGTSEINNDISGDKQHETMPPADSAGPIDEPPWFSTFRIVSGAETGELTLAENGASGTEVYMLSTQSLPKSALPEQSLQDGQLINVYFTSVMESWPMQFGGVSAIEITDNEIDNRAALYLRVLEDLWEKDSGLNSGVEIIGVDLAQTSLTPAEQSAVVWLFAGSHNVEPVVGSLDELAEQGYITATPLSSTGSGTDLDAPKHYFYEWENGCHFSIREAPEELADSYTLSLFDAQKWRSSLGAYFFSNCWLAPAETGGWSDYSIGAEMIS